MPIGKLPYPTLPYLASRFFNMDMDMDMDIPLPTTTSACATISGPAVNSPSDLSCASGPSYTSTSRSSPDSSSLGTFSYTSSPIVGVSMATAGVGYTTNTPPDKPSSMDTNVSRSVDDRRNKMAGERLTGCHVEQPQLQQRFSSPPPYTARTGVQTSPDHYRHLISTNWRNQTGGAMSFQSPIGHHSPLEISTAHHAQQTPMNAISFRNSDQFFQPTVPHPYPGSIPDSLLDSTFAYCFDRGNGQFTRLIPADMLPPLKNIPATQQGCTGMVVVPQPRGLAPDGHSSNTERVSVQTSPNTPTSPADVIQSRIDNIVANTPPTPTQPTGPSQLTSPIQRRPKVYCDKWVHEGVCAFTQQGCKYKHEMPSDRATQHQLGLFHGYPQWWKKHQAEIMRQREPSSPQGSKKDDDHRDDSRPRNERCTSRANDASSGNGRPRDGGLGVASDTDRQPSWSRGGEYGTEIQGLGVSFASLKMSARRGLIEMRNSMSTSLPSNGLSSRSPFGPIAPPTRNPMPMPLISLATETPRGPSSATVAVVTQSTAEAHAPARDTPRSSPTGATTGFGNPPVLPKSNPYSTLLSYDTIAEKNTVRKSVRDERDSPAANGARLL